MEDSKIENLVQAWSEMYMGEVLEFAKPKDVSNEEVFGDVYHSLIHSSVAETLVRLEHSNAQVTIDNHWISQCSQINKPVPGLNSIGNIHKCVMQLGGRGGSLFCDSLNRFVSKIAILA